MKHAKNGMYKKDSRESVSKSFLKVKMLDSLTATCYELASESKYKQTLLETQRKQNMSNGLTNINDSTFEFIIQVDKKRLSMQHHKMFNLYGSDILGSCHTFLLKDTALFHSWRNLFGQIDVSETYLQIPQEVAEICLHELYEDMIKRFCKIADNQFRKDTLSKIGRTKTDRLRKRIDNKSSSSKESLNMKIIQKDKSNKKQSTHLKLQSGIFDMGTTVFNSFTKNDLLRLCKAYNIKMPSNSTNIVIKEKLCSIISSIAEIQCPNTLDETETLTCVDTTSTSATTASQSQEPGTSKFVTASDSEPVQLRKRKGIRKLTVKSKKKSAKVTNKLSQHEKQTICPLCKAIYEEGQDWISCDLCDIWYDRKCSKITDTEWDNVENRDWYCQQCVSEDI